MNIQQFADEQRRAEMARLDKMYESNLASLQTTFDAQMQGISRSYKKALADLNKHYGIDTEAAPQPAPALESDDSIPYDASADSGTLNGEDMRRTGNARALGMVPGNN